MRRQARTRRSTCAAVEHRAAAHRVAHRRQHRKGASHSDFLASGPKVDADAPVQPMRAGLEAIVPPSAGIEPLDEHEQFIRGGIDSGGELRDRLAELF
jgi:hypothetical protein